MLFKDLLTNLLSVAPRRMQKLGSKTNFENTIPNTIPGQVLNSYY